MSSCSAVRRGVADIELERSIWGERLELMSTECAGLRVAVLCVPSPGPPRRPVRLPLRGIRFDEGEDLLTMTLGGAAGHPPELTLYVERPRRITTGESLAGRMLVITPRRGAGLRVLMPCGARAGGVMRPPELEGALG